MKNKKRKVKLITTEAIEKRDIRLFSKIVKIICTIK